MKYLAILIATCLLFVSCGTTPVTDTKIELIPDWNDLQVGLLLASYGQWDTGRLESFEYYVQNLGVVTNQVLYAKDRNDLYSSIDSVGNPVPDSNFASLLNTTGETFKMFKDKMISTATHQLEMFDEKRIKERISSLMNRLRVKNSFETINIQVDPSLSPGLTRAIVDGKNAKLFVHPQITYESFDQAFIVALLERVSDEEDFDLTQINKLTKQYGGSLTGWEQFLSDFAYALQLWCGAELDIDMMTYLNYSSVKFDHIFSAQLSHWSGNYMQFLEMNLRELVPNAVDDASNPIYERLLARLVDPARLGIVLDSDDSNSLIISGFVAGTPAETSGLLIGDKIHKLDTEEIKQRWTLESKLYDKDPNSYVILKVLRKPDLPTDGALSVIQDEFIPDYSIVSFQFLVVRAANLPEGVY